MRTVAGKNTLHQRHLCSHKISTHIYINQKNSMSEICADSERLEFQLTDYSYLCSEACFESTEVKDVNACR